MGGRRYLSCGMRENVNPGRDCSRPEDRLVGEASARRYARGRHHHYSRRLAPDLYSGCVNNPEPGLCLTR